MNSLLRILHLCGGSILKWTLLLVLFLTTSLYSGEPVPVANFTANDVKCLAANIHFEARGESHKGQVAVAHVTLNRVKDKRFPKSICGVVKQPGQFSWYKQANLSKMKLPRYSQQIALDVLTGKYKDPTRGALFFHNSSVESFKRRELIRIGDHIFYG